MYRILHGGKYELLRRYFTDLKLRIEEPRILWNCKILKALMW